MTTIYNFTVQKANGDEVSLEEYKGKVVLIVNTATKCGLAPQFKELQAIYEQYKTDGLEVLGFPSNQFMNQEPLEDDQIASACELNFGVTFPLFKKINVNGPSAHPLYKHLKEKEKGVLSKEIKWNFTKFLINRDGEVINRYSPQTSPKKIETDINQLLQS
ncbi:glutathione peroxidase [Salipaludibacillus agaradhaerens]|uniref:glutathione peroxidase n=1 Tax=Salipaludibacillus agaradhaerens TaxID=76935 RepID=UPI002150E0CA|nr:glutathione peroxidase [Salipaludibacillus agaradhaerens]MCR6106693.1 glutathione peroxidase [Salipaludibacillus agaradhaerens]MCR6118726.1 glutathione peroxidase [Salipaludibacillus agaradhaerens]